MRLDKDVLADPAVAGLMNEKFVSIKINAKESEGKDLTKEFNVDGFPTGIVIDPATKAEVDRIDGYQPPKEYIASLKKILSGDNFAALKKKAEERPDDVEAWVRYARALEGRVKREKLIEAWKKVAALDPADAKRHGARALLTVARIEAASAGGPDPLLDLAVKNDGKPLALDAHNYVITMFSRAKDEKYRKQVIASFDYIVAHGQRDPETLHDFASFLLARGEALEKALSLAEEALKAQPEATDVLDTAAECLSRLGRKADAVAMAKRAVEAASEAEKPRYEKRVAELEGK